MFYKLVNSKYGYFLIHSCIPFQQWHKISVIQNYYSVTPANFTNKEFEQYFIHLQVYLMNVCWSRHNNVWQELAVRSKLIHFVNLVFIYLGSATCWYISVPWLASRNLQFWECKSASSIQTIFHVSSYFTVARASLYLYEIMPLVPASQIVIWPSPFKGGMW